MKRKAYAKYKDSGVEWLGQVPEHWEVRRLKFLVTTLGGGTPNTSKPEYWDGEIPWVSPKDMKSIAIDDAEDHITELGLRDSASNLIPAQTVLVVMRSGILKHTIPVAISQVPVAINQDMKALFSENTLSAKYLYYFIEGLQKFLLPIWTKQGCTVESIETDYMVNTLFPVIDFSEQTAIAAFLDQKTAQIDALIQKKKELIARLGEQRIALITQAVTKGLNPKVKLKDSGVEWLGQVPEHWEVRRLKFACTCNDDVLSEDTEPDEIIEYVDISSVSLSSGITSVEEIEFDKAPSRARRKVKDGDTIISTVRTYLKAIAPIVAPSDQLIVSTGFAVIRPQSIAESRFTSYFLQSEVFIQSVVAHSTGVSYPAIAPSDLVCLILCLPPIDEQSAIAAFLDQKTAQIDALVRKAEEAVAKLEEYRMAVITAAVTGKVDVRK